MDVVCIALLLKYILKYLYAQGQSIVEVCSVHIAAKVG